jgi:hypothetical protein
MSTINEYSIKRFDIHSRVSNDDKNDAGANKEEKEVI